MQVNLNELLHLSTSLHILYVEDDVILRENTVALLSDLFASIDEASDGEEALILYRQNPTRYDILITDLNMPHMSGMELVKHVQTINPSQLVVVISAHNETEYFLESIRNNVNGYILKPIDFNQLLEALYKVSLLCHERKESALNKEKIQALLAEQNQQIVQSSQQIHEFLTVDKITRLQNATMLYNFLDHCPKDLELTAMLYNIDDFSFINQTYGVDFADATLHQVGEFLQFNIDKDVHLYRYNSDEFVIIFEPKIIHPELFAVQIQAFFRETPIGEINDKPLYITLSCGIATSKSPALLLPNARIALREAKMRGIPSQFNIYNTNDPFLKRSESETTWIQKFRLALEEDNVIPYFQPIVDNQTEEIVKYECLARIEEDGDIISPAHFLEAARRSGLMSNLTRMMINKSFKIFANHAIEFSINLTTEDLLNPTFIDFLTAKQKLYGIDPKNVIFEVLEDLILSDTHQASLHTLRVLKSLGYRLALDDFGSDRSNFNRLDNIGVSFLKIDGRFIQNIHQNARNQDIVETITSMAHKLDMRVIAEFVATKEEFDTVKKLGVDFSQGYFFQAPMQTPKPSE